MSGESFAIDVRGRAVFVQMHSVFCGPIGLRVDRALKTSRIAATVEHLTGERAYSPGSTVMGGTDKFAKRLEEELGLELFDAIRVDFEVTCEQSLGNPYVVAIARFRERDAKPGMVQSWIFAKALEPIGSKRQKLHILESGFPRGYTLLDYEVHLYDQGLDVASNVAPKRVGLSADEAFQYMVIDYVSSHKGATLGAVPVLATLPAEYRTRLQAGQYRDSIFVKVSKVGRAEDAFFDAAGSRKLDDEYLLGILETVRFKPLLVNGKPVDGITELRLNQLSSL